jgi:hypothetical protein
MPQSLSPVTVAVFALMVSIAALSVSATTLWLTLLRRGKLRMSRPTQIMFTQGGPNRSPQIFFRAMLYSTSRRGHVVENMYVRARRGETSQNLNVWVFGEERLSRGSGLFVGPDGVARNHHFLHPEDGSRFEFLPGQYVLEVFATLVSKPNATKLAEIPVVLSPEHSASIQTARGAVFFDWGPDSQGYHAHSKPSNGQEGPGPLADLEAILAALRGPSPKK